MVDLRKIIELTKSANKTYAKDIGLGGKPTPNPGNEGGQSLLDKNFYLSSTQISPIGQLKGTKMNHIYYDCGDNIDNFNEQKLIKNYANLEFHDLQGSHWAPHIMSRKL